jgi:hypothetical protein
VSTARHRVSAADAPRLPRGLRALAIGALLLLSLSTASAAFAYFGGTAAGSGTGATGTTATLTLAAGAGGTDLYPGASGTVTTTASNGGTALARIVGLALDTTQGTGGFAVDAAHAGCPTTSLSFAAQSNGGAGWNVAAGGTLAITLASALTMSASAPSACQGAVVTVYLAATS